MDIVIGSMLFNVTYIYCQRGQDWTDSQASSIMHPGSKLRGDLRIRVCLTSLSFLMYVMRRDPMIL